MLRRFERLECASGYFKPNGWECQPSRRPNNILALCGTLETEERETEKEMIKTSFIMMFGVIQEGLVSPGASRVNYLLKLYLPVAAPTCSPSVVWRLAFSSLSSPFGCLPFPFLFRFFVFALFSLFDV